MKKITIIFAFLFSGLAITDVAAQIGAGLVFGGDYYQWYRNPEVANEVAQLSTGSVLLNVSGGPKIWFGGEKFTLSVEGHLNWGITAFDMHEYKGMGNLSFPLIAKLNFGSVSGFGDRGGKGFYLGGGMQFTRTEAYGLTADYIGNTTRGYFRTLIGEIGFGSGEDGVISTTFVRIGIGDDKAFTLNVGSVIDFNIGEFVKNMGKDVFEEEEDEQIQSFL